jgi:mono/diheme cytochrome c family protein
MDPPLRLLVLVLLTSCYTGARFDPDASDPTVSVTGTNPSAPPAEDNLPCEVATLLTELCATCHGEPLANGAKTRLLDANELASPSKTDPSKTVADDCVARMKDTARPMPPSGLLDAHRIAVLESWIAAGMPNGTCDATTGTSTLPSTPTVCSSDTYWTRGDHGSALMHPGKACIDCHSSTNEDDAPLYRVAGTVYPTAHEPDDCYGIAGSVTVEITDANGKTYALPVNRAGNFFSRTSITTPYKAKVTSNGKTRSMVAAQTSGDCNACHTEQGTENAPGRIVAP